MQNITIREFIRSNKIPKTRFDGLPYYFNNERFYITNNRIFPGYFYAFTLMQNQEIDLPTLNEYQIDKGIKPYYDNKPIILLLENPINELIGLNIKILNPNQRLLFLKTYFVLIKDFLNLQLNSNKDFIELEERLTVNNNQLFNNMSKAIRNIGQYLNIDLDFIIDKYTKEDIRELAIIDWPHIISVCNYNYMNDQSILTRTPLNYFF